MAQVGAAQGAGGGLWWFHFRSATADVEETFMFTGLHFGAGGSIGGVPLPDLSGDPLYTPIECLRPFSVRDLHLSGGWLESGGVSFMVGYSLVQISAAALTLSFDEGFTRDWFSKCLIHGLVAGVGASLLFGPGMWHSAALAARNARRAARRTLRQRARR
jgi:hypothetical protein